MESWRECAIGLSVVAGLAAGCSTGGQPAGPEGNPPPGPGAGSGSVALPFTADQLRTGQFEGILHCAGPLHVPQEYEDYVAAFPATPPISFVFYYSLIDARFGPAEKQAVIASQLATYGGVPFLGLSYTSRNPDGSSTGHDDEVAAGQFDQEIRDIADLLAADGRPILFRPGFEFNGAWNGYTPTTYVAAFRRIHDLFVEEGADNVVFVWNYHPAGTVAPYMEFYPGDGYVDWWGVNLFGKAFQTPQAANVQAFLANATSRGKPTIIPEAVPNKFFDMESMSTWNEWFQPYFDLIAGGLKAFCYSNRDYTKVPAWSDWGDLRIEQSATLRPLWAAEISKPQYVHLR